MDILKSASDLKTWRSNNDNIALVPTMGALHKGHLSLVLLAKQKAKKVIVSIFVNPTQFAPHEDLDTYPRDTKGDLAKLDDMGVNAVYMPETEDMYPDGIQATRTAGDSARILEGEFRPTHFDGVVTIVSTLFDQIKPDVAIFGEKDYQQLQVLREAFPNQNIIGAPIMRDEHGLALSSRNAYLSDEELQIARTLNQILFQTADIIREFPKETHHIIPLAIQALLDAGFDSVDYLDMAFDPPRLLAAAHIGKTRLIDNVSLT